ncbi:MAG: VanZ family protein [Shimia sp.]
MPPPSSSRITAAALALVALLWPALTFFLLSPATGAAPDDVAWLDPAANVAGFAALALPLAAALPRLAVPVALVVAGYGVGMELLQPRFGRSFETSDVIALTCGAALGAAAGVALRRMLMR